MNLRISEKVLFKKCLMVCQGVVEGAGGSIGKCSARLRLNELPGGLGSGRKLCL